MSVATVLSSRRIDLWGVRIEIGISMLNGIKKGYFGGSVIEFILFCYVYKEISPFNIDDNVK